jgi:hypothetical protein
LKIADLGNISDYRQGRPLFKGSIMQESVYKKQRSVWGSRSLPSEELNEAVPALEWMKFPYEVACERYLLRCWERFVSLSFDGPVSLQERIGEDRGLKKFPGGFEARRLGRYPDGNWR